MARTRGTAQLSRPRPPLFPQQHQVRSLFSPLRRQSHPRHRHRHHPDPRNSTVAMRSPGTAATPACSRGPLPHPQTPNPPLPPIPGQVATVPNDILARVCAALAVPSADALATMLVQPTCYVLRTAVLEYAALAARHHALAAPLLVCSTTSVPRAADSRDPDESDDEDDDAPMHDGDLDAMESAAVLQMRAPPATHNAPRPTGALPQFLLGFGEVAVLWPPPHALSAAVLHADETAKREAAFALQRGAAETIPSHAPEIPADTVGHRDVFIIAHFPRGDPVASHEEYPVQYSDTLVATTAGMPALRAFAQDILCWDACRRPDPPRFVSRFQLHRFRMEGESGYWNCDGARRARPPASVILANDQMTTILDDVRYFLGPSTRKWYDKHGVPPRRAYLFFGPPGTGKTSTVRAIASAFNRQCCFLSMANSHFSNQALGDALASIPKKALLVLEDVDALFTKRKSRGKDLTFSGLLNALDGMVSADGVITVMTTNKIENLDEALLRGGRVDRRFYFGPPGDGEVAAFFRSFYEEAADETVQKFVKKIASRPVQDGARSFSTLQQLFILKRELSADECVESVDEFFETFFPDGTGEANGKVVNDAVEKEDVDVDGDGDGDGDGEMDDDLEEADGDIDEGDEEDDE